MVYVINEQAFYIFHTQDSYTAKVFDRWITADTVDELIDSINDYIYQLMKAIQNQEG